MDVSSSTFSISEIEKIFAAEKIFRGTTTFITELDRRFRPSDIEGQYVEREDYQPHSALFDAVMNGEIDPKQVLPRRHSGNHFDVV